MAPPPYPRKSQVTSVSTVDSAQDEAASNAKPLHEASSLSEATEDLITVLPAEVVLHLLKLMDPKDVLKLAQTCHILRFRSEDDILWEGKCSEANLQYCLDSSEEDLLRHRDTASLQEILNRLGGEEASFEFSKWKANFVKHIRIEMNFRQNPIRRPIEIGDHEVTDSLEFIGDKIVFVGESTIVKIWDPSTGNCLNLEGHTRDVMTIQVEDHIIVSGSWDSYLKVWDGYNGQCIRTLEGPSGVRSSHLHEERLVAGYEDGTVCLYDINEGTRLNVFLGHDDTVNCVQYNGRLVASGSWDNTVKVWCPETDECLHTFVGHTSLVLGVLFAGDYVVSSSYDESIRVWDVEEGTCKHKFEEYEGGTWERPNTMKLRGNTLVSAHANSVVKIWDTRSWECLRIMEDDVNKHSGLVDALDFNDKFVVTGSTDGKMKLWDFKTGDFIRDLLVLEEHGYVDGQVEIIKMKDAIIACLIGYEKDGDWIEAILVLNFGNVL